MKPHLFYLLLLCQLPLFTGHAAAGQKWGLLQANPVVAGTDSDTPPAWKTVPRARFGTNAVAPAASASGLPIVRLGYIIPSNRTAQSDGVDKMRALVLDAQRWYRDQMDQQGYGPKTFRVETEADGITPQVHVVKVTETDDYLRGDAWTRTITAAQNAGLTLWTSGEVWFVVPEIHLQAADGSLSGAGVALGASNGSGNDPGVAMISGDSLAMCRAGMPSDDRAYDGSSVAEVGPYPLKQDVTYPWYAGTTFSSVCSSSRGSFTHELSHAFGLAHDFRNDSNFHGNLMGNGLRGFRGAFAPAHYPSDYTRLSAVAAGALNVSRYFNSSAAASSTRPAVNVTTSGAVTPTSGLLPVAFNASSSAGLAFAWLTLNGNVVGELPLAGTYAATRFSVPSYTPGSANSFSVTVFDQWGNRQDTATSITPDPQSTQAPLPYLKILPPVPLPGETVTLDASLSSDPVTPAAKLRVEWDYQGNGNFTPASASPLAIAANWSGNRFVRLRVTNAANAKSVSAPIALHAHQPSLALASTSSGTTLTWLSKIGFLYQLQRSGNLQMWVPDNLAPFSGDGSTLRHDDPPVQPNFQRLQISRINN